MVPVCFKSLAVFAVVTALLFQSACSASTIAAVAKSEAVIESSCNAAFTLVVQGNTSGLISTADATAINTIILKVEQANGIALTATAAMNELTAAGQASLLADLQPLVAALNTAVTSGTSGIKDPTTQKNVLEALTLIQTGLNATVAILQAAKTS
jgi:hypothetical protein